jgi:hypothetical protein
MNILDKLSEIPTRRMEAALPLKKNEPSPRAYFLLWTRRTILALSLLLFLGGIYLYASRVIPHNSDDASILLQAYNLIHSSKILNGWYLPSDNFITLDMPLYALGLKLGLNMSLLMQIIPVLLYTGTMLSGIYLASLGKKGKQKLLAPIAFMAIAVFPSLNVLTLVLQGPIHVGTIFGTLLAFIAYYFSKERSYKVVSLLILGILTLLLVIGDPMSEIILVLPILLVEGILLYKSKFTSRNQYAIIGTVLLNTLLALYMRHVWEHYVHILTYSTLNVETIPNIVKLAQDAAQIVFTLFHADIFQRNIFSPKILPELLNMLVVLLLAVGIWKWLKKIFSLQTSHDALTAVLTFAIIANILVFVCTNVADDLIVRYLLPVFVFGGIIALPVLSYIKKPELYIATIGLFLLNGSFFFYTIYRLPPVRQPEKAVISFLQEKHLTKGIGQYWSAASITGQSNYTITIRQVKVFSRQLHPSFLLSNDSWFHDDALKDSQFIIYRKTDTGFYLASIRSFGKPDYVYTVGDYIILAWNTPLLRHALPGYHLYVPLSVEEK